MIPNKAAFRDAFNLYEKHLRSMETASFSWETLCDEMIAIANRHANDPLLMDLLVAVHAELERKWMEKDIPTRS